MNRQEKIKTHILLFGSIFFILHPRFTWAYTSTESNYEEVSYNELVDELNSRVKARNKVEEKETPSDPFERLTIHTSFGLINSIHYLSLPDRNISRFEDGIGLGFGIDLFNPEWIAEANLKNYGRSTRNEQTLSMRELELRLSYLESKSAQNNIKIIQGLGARYLKFSAPYLASNIKESTPVYLIGVSVNSRFTQKFSLGIEITGSFALVTETVEKNSINLNIKFDNYF
jgi:hypothetical protein